MEKWKARADLCLNIDVAPFKPQVLTSPSLSFLIYNTGMIRLKTVERIRENVHKELNKLH